MEKYLPVPYKSQHDSDSYISNNDCGPASLAMCLEFFGTKITTGEVLQKLGNPKGFTTIAQLAKVAKDLGYNAESKVDATFHEIKKYIEKGIPVIVVGGYSYLQSRQDKNFTGSHIMVVTGYREDDSVYANDPDFWGQFKTHGDHHVYTSAEFNNFWRNDGNKEGNQPNILFVIYPKNQEKKEKASGEFPSRVIVTASIPLRARTEPKLNDVNIAKRYTRSTELDVLDAVLGENVEGNNVWYLVKDTPNLYIWSGAVSPLKVKEEKKEEPKKEEAVKEAPKQEEKQPQKAKEVDSSSDEDIRAIQTIYELTRNYLHSKNALPDQKAQEQEKREGFLERVKKALKIA